MTDERDVDTGPPIEALRELREEAAPRFALKVRDRLERRFLTSHLADMLWSAGAAMFRELLEMLHGLFSGNRTEEGDSE